MISATLHKKFDKLKTLIETDTEAAIEYFPELQDAVEDDISELKDEIVDLESELDDLRSENSENESEVFNLQNEIEDLNPPKNLYEEQKHEVSRRLLKNLSLEQLENLEQTVKNSFKSNKKNYILELP